MRTVVLRAIEQRALDFIHMEDSVYKNILYNRDFHGHTFTEANIVYKEDKIYYAYSEYKIRRGVKYFLKKSAKNGFTFDTTTNKLQIWYGKNVQNLIMIQNAVLSIVNNNWMNNSYWDFMTKSLVEKILAKKITNEQDLAKAILKLHRVKGSHSKFHTAITERSLSKQRFLIGVNCAKNFDHFLDHHVNNSHDYNNDLFDLERQAVTLNRKIDYTWSEKRIKSEHEAWTKELMSIEAESIPDQTVTSLQRFDGLFPNNWEILNTQKRVYIEGKSMNHCVYTNYWDAIKAGNYLAVHIIYGDEEATLGMRLNYDKYNIHQLYTKHNQRVSDEMQNYVNGILLHLNTSDHAKSILDVQVPVFDTAFLPF